MKKGTTVGRTWLWVSLILTSLLGLLLTGAAQDSVWTRKTDMPYPTYHMGTTVIDGKFYLMTGWLGGGASRYFQVYDTQTDTWSRKADIPSSVLPIPISGATACEVDGKIYLMGGGGDALHVTGSIATLKVYNLATGTWTLKANIPTPRSAIAAEAVDGKIFAFGGVGRLNKWWDAVVKDGPFLNVVEEYDPVTDTWTRKADMSIARSSMASAVVDGKIYVIGGATNIDNMVLNTVEVYDPVTDTWAKKADMPTARWEPSAVVVGGKIYVIGGNIRPPFQNSAKVAIVEVYDPV
ncbi:MAG: kelch repeat-containing protein, partial [Candidatus Poribacteria bacterium]|nr:kelch repeat-containing protein [Candidatus Poribacteria bacterium]